MVTEQVPAEGGRGRDGNMAQGNFGGYRYISCLAVVPVSWVYMCVRLIKSILQIGAC